MTLSYERVIELLDLQLEVIKTYRGDGAEKLLAQLGANLTGLKAFFQRGDVEQYQKVVFTLPNGDSDATTPTQATPEFTLV